MYKNAASQKIAIYAHDKSADAPKTGDAANITAQISKDGGACAATNDTNPIELDAANAKGVYIFDMTQTETNADLIVLSAVSSTDNVQIEPVIIYTQVDFVRKWHTNKLAFNGNTMTLYDDDDVTPLMTWTLSKGNLSVGGPFNRAKGT